MKPLSDCRLYAFVDTAYLRARNKEPFEALVDDGFLQGVLA